MGGRLAALLIAALGMSWGQAGGELPLLAYFPADISPAVVKAMHDESEELFEPVGISVGLYPMPQVVHTSGRFGTVMVQFHGNCADFRHATQHRRGQALATTETEGRSIRPIILVDCDQVGALLNETSHEPDEAEMSTLFGRGLARVVAHELYHYLTQSFEHHHSQLFSHSMSRVTLVSEHLAFTTMEIETLKRAVGRPVAALADAGD